jgi:SAM-dependent methyltransferase
VPDPRAIGEQYDAGADGYDARHSEDRAARVRTATLDRLQVDAVRGARRVLELGCGTGRLLARVAAPERIGVDVAARMLAHARARGLDVARGDGNALPFADRSFDAIVSGKGVFRYLDPARAFAECARVLRPGGVLALHNYGNRTLSWRGPSRPQPDLWELGSIEELLTPAGRAGFVPRRLYRLRPIRIYPYFLEIPSWLDARAPFQLWSHLVAVLNAAR